MQTWQILISLVALLFIVSNTPNFGGSGIVKKTNRTPPPPKAPHPPPTRRYGIPNYETTDKGELR